MYNVTYISNSDRARLVELNEALRAVETVEDQRKVREEISNIEERRKPLHECTLDEVVELRTFVWGKFDKLNRAGQYRTAQQFKVMLTQIEIRQGLIYQEMAKEEAARAAENAKIAQQQMDSAKEKRKKGDKSTGTRGSQSTSSRWTTGIGNLD